MMRRIGFVIATMVLVVVTTCFSVATVRCVTNVEAQELEAFYLEKEETLVEDVREFLNQEGFVNSGIMLTRVVGADGSRQYTMTIHHGCICKMSSVEQADLQKRLEELVFVDEGCSFSHEFLVTALP